MRRLICITAALVILGSVAAAPAVVAAPPSDPAANHKIAINAHFDDLGGLLTPHTCSPATTGLCQYTITTAPAWTGTFTGSSITRGYFSYNPSTREGRGVIWEYFPQVTVGGCGTGTMMWRGEIVFKSEQQDPTKGGLVMDGTWGYVRGSGTGDLANIQSGTFSVDDVVFKLPFFENHDDAVGSLTCRGPGS